MARAGYATLEGADFEKDGRSIAYKKVSLTEEGEELYSTANLHLLIPDAPDYTAPKKRATRDRKPKFSEPAKPGQHTAQAQAHEPEMTPAELELEKKLKTWRREEAKKYNFPAFRIFGDKTLRAIVLDRPKTMDDLLQVNGIGPEKAAKFGESICALCAEN